MDDVKVPEVVLEAQVDVVNLTPEVEDILMRINTRGKGRGDSPTVFWHVPLRGDDEDQEGFVRTRRELTYFAWERGQRRGTGNSGNRERPPGS